MLLHHLDNLDSKMECVRGAIERDRSVEGVWTSYCPPLDRSLLKKEKFLEPEPAPPAPVERMALPLSGSAGSLPAPAAAAAGATPREKRPADAASPFAAKLQDALGGRK